MNLKSLKKYYKDRKVLITGGNGFIGSFVVEKLLKLGSHVTVLIRQDSSIWRLKDIKEKIKFIRVDLTNREETVSKLRSENYDLIINIAGNVNTNSGLSAFSKLIDDNCNSLINLLIAASEMNNLKKVVQVGSIAEYGSQKAPFIESTSELPCSPYGLSKNIATKVLLGWGKLVGLDTTVVRPAATYGPRQTPGIMLIPNVIQSGLKRICFNTNKANRWRDFVYVEDLADGIIASGELKKEISGKIINLGSNRCFKIKDVITIVNKQMNNPVKAEFSNKSFTLDDPRKFYMNSGLANKVLGWKAQINLKDGIDKTIEWYYNEFNKIIK